MDEPRTEADNGSAKNPPRHTAGTGSARPEHGALARRDYGLLAPAGMVVNQSNVGDTGSEAGHGGTSNQDGTGTEEERYKTVQRALPTRGNNGVGDEARGQVRPTRGN